MDVLSQRFKDSVETLMMYHGLVDSGISNDPRIVKIKDLSTKWLNFFHSFEKYEKAVEDNEELHKEAIQIRTLTVLGIIALANDDIIMDQGVNEAAQERRMREYLTKFINFRKKLIDNGLIND